MTYNINKFSEAARNLEKKARIEGRLIENPSEKEIEDLTGKQPGVKTTRYGSLVADSEPNSRAAKHSRNNIDDVFGEEEDRLLEQMARELDGKKLISIDRRVGLDGPVTRLILPYEFVQIAHIGGKLFIPAGTDTPDNYMVFFYDKNFESNKDKKLPDKDITIRLAMMDDGRIVKIVRNSNYTGEYKKGNFAAEEWRVKKKTEGIFLHAGCRTDYLESVDGDYEQVTSLLIALSANGKTSTTCKVLAKKENEESWLIQDDGGALMPYGSFHGFEAGGVFVKTEEVHPGNQMEIYYGLKKRETALENVYIDDKGNLDFFNFEKTSNGRATIKRRDFMHASYEIDAEKVDNLILITRGPIIPAISKLTREQAVALMILGQAMESSAGDPTQAGKLKNEFFYDPFFVGDKAEHAHRFYGILNQNPEMNFYLINTGGIGEGNAYNKIRLEDTMNILDSLFRGGLNKWEDSPSGFKVPVAIRNLSNSFLHPEKLYSRHEFDEMQKVWNRQRREIIESIEGLDSKIRYIFK